jgi:hypothetical protein
MPFNGPLSSLPWFTLDPAWVEQSAAFTDADPRMPAAYIRLLLAAWRGLPAATIPASHQYIAQVTGLDVGRVGEKFEVLTEGFELLSDGRLHHAQMERLALRLGERFGADIEELSVSAAMAVQDPQRFALVAAETAGAGTRGRRSLPKGFGYEMHPQLRHWCAEQGFDASQDQQWLMDRFIDYSVARGERAKDWAAAFRSWAARELSYGRRPPGHNPGAQALLELSRPSASAAFAKLATTRGERARVNNAQAFGLGVR